MGRRRAVTNELIADPDVVRAVADALAQDERTAAYVLRVDSRHGLVILRGEVPSEAVQQAAIDIAASVPGRPQRPQSADDRWRNPAGRRARATGARVPHGSARVTQTSPQPAERLSSRQKRIEEQRRKIDAVRIQQRRRRMIWGAIIIVVVAIAAGLVVLFFPRPVSGSMRQVVTEAATHVDEGAPLTYHNRPPSSWPALGHGTPGYRIPLVRPAAPAGPLGAYARTRRGRRPVSPGPV